MSNEDGAVVQIDGSPELCSCVARTVFDFVGVADWKPLIVAPVVKDPAPVKGTPSALKEKLDASPRNVFYWTKKRDDLLENHFFKDGVDKMLQDDVIPGASREIILKRAEFKGMKIGRDS